MPPTHFETLITTQFQAARARLADDSPWVLLHIGTEFTGVAVGRGAAPEAVMALTMGAQITAREHFKHSPPSPLTLENAIVTVEDEIARVHQLVPAGARLVTTDAAIREIAALSGITTGEVLHLPLDAVERSFERLAQVSLGQPASRDKLPANNAFAATLLILREFMHHLQFDDITVLPGDAQMPP